MCGNYPTQNHHIVMSQCVDGNTRCSIGEIFQFAPNRSLQRYKLHFTTSMFAAKLLIRIVVHYQFGRVALGLTHQFISFMRRETGMDLAELFKHHVF